MKKLALKVLSVLCAATMVMGFTSCGLLGGGSGNGNSSTTETPAVTYTLDSSKFNKEVVFGDSLNANTLSLKGSDGKTVAVKSNMVSGWDTSSAGQKTLTVKYEGKSYNVNYTVKYEVKFQVNGDIVKTQKVLSANEIVYPANPTEEGKEFKGWNPTNVTELTGNLVIKALFEGVVEEEATLTIEGNNAVYVREFGEGGSLALTASFGSLTANNFEVTASNENVTITKGHNILLLSPVKAGVTTITVCAEDPNTGDEVSATKTIVVKPRSMMVAEKKLGAGDIEGVYTMGRTDVNGNVIATDFDVNLGTEGDIGGGLLENIVWESNNKLVSVDKDGKVTLAEGTGAEMVELKAKFVVNGETYDESENYAVRCVFDGVNVSNYAELYMATKAEKPVVLNANIKDDFSATNHVEINTTYNDAYYKNQEKDAKIKVLLQIKNDLYGNGYQINAHNATLGMLDATGAPKADALFRNGPLNFVAMGNDQSGMLSVKAQDNVCFGVYEGVTVNNVELRSGDLTADENGNYDLTDLNYAGTTVEVFGDDVTIEYSRITNGRTVLRIFGDEKDSEKAIHVDIKNSVLSGAREFILRMGSNRFVKSDKEASPYLAGDNGTALNAKKMNSSNYYGNMSAADKKAYDDKYINTFVNIKNSVFKDAGIFAIGMDAHFAGEALHDPESSAVITGVLGESVKHWANVARTSYGAKLSFEGDVRMYNWKLLDQIDSSTLIENLGPDGWQWDSLTFDVKTMVEGVSNDPRFSSIITTHNGKKYVHAGIAFFGGGRNYSVFENSAESEPLVGFTVSLDDVGQSMLKTAAGEESFYFMLCDKTSSFSVAEQERILASEDAYACLKK